MLNEVFKKVFKSRKTVSIEEAKKIQEELNKLRKDVLVREAQVLKLGKLMITDSVNTAKYAKRINIHNRIINDNKQKIQELEIKLLDS